MKLIDKIKNNRLLTLKQYYNPYKGYFILGLFFIILTSVTQVSLPFLFGKLIDGANQETFDLFNSLNSTAIAIFVLFVLNCVFRAIKDYFFSVFAEKSSIRIMNDVYSTLIRKPLKFYDENAVGELFGRITTDVNAFRNIFSEQIASVLYQPIIIIFCIIILLSINIKLTLLLIVVLPVAGLLTILLGEKIRKLSRETYDSYAKANTILEESLQLIRTIKLFNTEKKEEKKYSEALNVIINKSISVSFIRIILEALGSFLILLSLIIVVWYASTLVLSDQITIGRLIEFIVNTVFIATALSSMANAYGTIQKTAGATEKIEELLKVPTEDIPQYNPENQIIFEKVLIFKQVSFRYPTRSDIEVYKDFNLKLEKGLKIGIIGESGGGKSTLVQLLLRFYDLNEGSIEMDGKDINLLSLSNYRRIFGVVSQEIKLFSGTIKDNIIYGCNEVTDEQIQEACRLSNVEHFITKLPDGLNSLIGDNGVTLSGGQRQRVAIARAIIINPQILIFDEATSALDRETESIINNNLLDFMKDKTTIILSHRLSIITKMDRVYKVENGEIFELDKNEIM